MTHGVFADPTIEQDGRLQGYVMAPYAAIVGLLGPPNSPSTDAVRRHVEWLVRTPAGPAWIYNWKIDLPAGVSVEQITNWHVGGNTVDVVQCVAEALHAPADIAVAHERDEQQDFAVDVDHENAAQADTGGILPDEALTAAYRHSLRRSVLFFFGLIWSACGAVVIVGGTCGYLSPGSSVALAALLAVAALVFFVGAPAALQLVRRSRSRH
jgi:hypothetical protein